MKNCDGSAKPAKALDLELPDWSGMDRFTPRLSPRDALLQNEKWREANPIQARPDLHLPKCEVEFVL
jgi:hypothetical protein